MQPSANFISFLANEEGFAPRAYLDPPGNTRGLHSIGYGHQIQPNEKQLLTAVLTQAQAQAMLQRDLGYYVGSVNANLTRPVTQSQFDALVDLAYNAGVGAAAKVIATWNATGSPADTVAHLQQYRLANGQINKNLVARRQHETNWFMNSIGQAVGDIEKKSTT
ncbi:MAG: lysozyme [Mucilaginibacter sp.]